MGRPPKPLERIQATARDATHKADGRPLVKVGRIVEKPEAPKVPYGVTGRGVEEWLKVWEAGYWLKPDQDYHLVEMIAQAYSDIEAWRKVVSEQGPITKGYAGQDAEHPLIGSIRKSQQLIIKCLSMLGFSPSDRARLQLTEAQTKSTLQQMIDGSKR